MTGEHWSGGGVRPTMRCLADDLRMELPHLGVRLEDVQHPCLEKAQMIPDQVSSDGAERIEALDDRIWYKVKTGRWRGAATKSRTVITGEEVDEELWWLGAAGQRRADSAQDDFYALLEQRCRAARKANRPGDARVKADSNAYLPTTQDLLRLQAERALGFHSNAQRLIRRLAAASLRSGHPVEATFNGWAIEVLLRADGTRTGEAYIVVTGAGLTDPTIFAVILSGIPGLTSADWSEEPSRVLGIRPRSGAVTFSACISPEAQAIILEQSD